MIDPDAPSKDNPTKAQWRHWLVINTKGEFTIIKFHQTIDCTKVINTLTGDSIETGGDVITKYKGPTPPKGSGKDFVFFVPFYPNEKKSSPQSPHLVLFYIKTARSKS